MRSLRRLHGPAVALRALAVAAFLVSSVRAEDLTGTLKKIKDTGVITLGHRESSIPFSYYDNNQKPVGYSMDLCRKVVEAVQAELKLPNLTVKLQPVNSSNRIPLVKNGTVDLECGSTANYVQRQEEVAFSVSTFWVSKKLIAKASSNLKTIDDLKGKPVVVTQGTDTATLIRKINDERQLHMNIISAKDHAESLLTVESGRALAFMEDDVLLAGLRANSRDPKSLVILQDSFGGDPYALMMRKDDPAFKKLVDSTLTGLMTSGEINKIYAKWFEGPIPPNGVTIGFPPPEKLVALFKAPSDRAAH